METINVEGAIAFVGTNLPAARPEERAGLEVPAECVQLTILLHGVTLPRSI
jgi:hypothetical protein